MIRTGRRRHNILLPNFSQQAMRDYVPMMNDIATQLMQKWQRLNPGEPVDVTADMTRLTWTRSRCACSGTPSTPSTATPCTRSSRPCTACWARVNDALGHCPSRPSFGAVPRADSGRELPLHGGRRSQQIIDERRRSGRYRRAQGLVQPHADRGGQANRREAERRQHRGPVSDVPDCRSQTISGLLSFAISFLIKHPDVVAQAQQEVDRVLGHADPRCCPPISKWLASPTLNQVLSETLRLWPTVSGSRATRTKMPRVGPY